MGCESWVGLFPHLSGEGDYKSGATVRGRRGADRAAAISDDAVTDGKAKAGSLVDFLGGEEWLEQPRKDMLVYAGSRVDDFGYDRATGGSGAESDNAIRLRAGLVGASVVYGVPGVKHEVDEYLLQAVGVSLHNGKIGR